MTDLEATGNPLTRVVAHLRQRSAQPQVETLTEELAQARRRIGELENKLEAAEASNRVLDKWRVAERHLASEERGEMKRRLGAAYERIDELTERLIALFQLLSGLRNMVGPDSYWTHADRNRFLENVISLQVQWRTADADTDWPFLTKIPGDKLSSDEVPF